MHTYLIDLLECPSCHGSLTWSISSQKDDRIIEAIARCQICAAEYPVREGIGIFLTPDLPRTDLWEQGGQQLSRLFSEHPEIEARLMDSPLSNLGPADQFFRGMALEERGEYSEAQRAFDAAMPELYTDDYRHCWQSQVDFVLEALAGGTNPVVDLASGRCYLVRDLIDATERPIVATDFSLHVLRRNREWLIHHGLYSRVSLLAFDARKTPFRDNSIETMTTNVGLPNIAEPENLLGELRRITSGQFLAVSHFYSADDSANLSALQGAKLVDSLLRESVLTAFREAGWRVSVRNSRHGLARPTPQGEILEGASIDGFPVVETILEWCVLEAR
ncbi:methyltransferase domain-containing protein [Candidatus Bipolaricaulota bacterium]|nr:methyltransferase domain-containing protein [Candidatus Bipolaricaulota bacterium]MCK5586803.1 methyltransferase domain-containing protein [Candidatus Bipolaricaulota bacterium]